MDITQKEVEEIQEEFNKEKEKQKQKSLIRFFGFFLLTLITTTMAGAEWSTQTNIIASEPFNMTWQSFLIGFEFSIPFLLFLTCHEFGHYLTAKYYKINVTLPFYMPFWLGFIGAPSFGTLGAFIRIREKIRTRLEYFDVGIAGPLAGFVIAVFVLYYGFTHLPPPEHIYNIHPEYEVFGPDYAQSIYDKDTFILKEDFARFRPELAQYYPDTIKYSSDGLSLRLGSNLIFDFFKKYVAPDPELVPNDFEIMHYPWLFAGYLALFFTALNLLPIGQLDGGHILYGLVGEKNHTIISSSLFIGFISYAGIGIIDLSAELTDLMLIFPLYVFFLYLCFYTMTEDKKNRLTLAVVVFSAQFFTAFYFPEVRGFPGWLLFAFLIGRFLGVKHPPVQHNQPLSLQRQLLGWLALLIFIGSFSPAPIITE